MSYILEALKRADAEREREAGAVPGLHAQSAVPAADSDTAAALPGGWIVAGAVGLLLLLVVAGWVWFGRGEAVPVAPAVVAVVAPVGVTPAPAPAPAPETRAAAPAATELVLPPSPAPVVREPEAALRRAPEAASAAAVPATQPSAPATPAATTTATNGDAASAPRIFTLAELPPEIRRELPQLVIGGATYSSDASQRMLIINTQIFRENDTLMPGLTVEQIRPKGAVLKYKGYRYEISY